MKKDNGLESSEKHFFNQIWKNSKKLITKKCKNFFICTEKNAITTINCTAKNNKNKK